ATVPNWETQRARSSLFGVSRSPSAKSMTQVSRRLLCFQPVAKGHGLEFYANGVGDRNHGMHGELKGRQHRAKLVHREWIVAVHEHMSAPIAHADDEHLDFEIVGRLPLAKDVQDSL